ncbi:predicted protein [Uncinocarpus reesii 1704]|uniref:Xylanolytic transcriptional activator regulatory domain-containing protein n=1 Tax=Uncinocarpus reesii (strain UAMH 1704) TaxID=336963 RepID=C4JXA5_UNCRE|nr:uncharacterized protein UREG_06278 [Uncinocarpus reesii 1704]EEP81413.1 predicted protein [Uncinocarpus reesii 1704]
METEDTLGQQSDHTPIDTKQNWLPPFPKENVTSSTQKVLKTSRSLASNSLAPFALLRKSATAGNFTIANILNVEDESPIGDDPSNAEDFAKEEFPIKDPNDPVNRNLLSMPSAQGLFDNFFKYLNPFTCQFDPMLHTMRYVRSRSSFLFSILLAAAAKVFSPQLYVKLHEHVESLLREILGSGQKSTEIVQGICLITHWKEPSDSRAWMLVGYAIRACMEMGWHKLNPTHLEPAEDGQEGHTKEMELRERRNRERTWLMLFVYDRSMSLQLGRPSMIHMDSLIRNAENWHHHMFAVPGIDEVMVAFVQLRILGFDLLDVFWLHPVATTPQAIDKDEFILKTFNCDLDRWEAKWYKTLDEANRSVCHRFLVRFYGHHLRLLIHSFRLQLSILSGNVSKQSLWICYSSALEMLRLVVNRLGTTSHLYYCQDSVHVMVAYAAVVIIKILLSMPGVLPIESENTILDLLCKASEDFGRQCSAINTSCFFQSRFLANVVAQYRKSKAKANAMAGNLIKKQHDGQHIEDLYMRSATHSQPPHLLQHPQKQQSQTQSPLHSLPSSHYPDSQAHMSNDMSPMSNAPSNLQATPLHNPLSQLNSHASQPDSSQLTASLLHAATTATTTPMQSINNHNLNPSLAGILGSDATPSAVMAGNNGYQSFITMNEALSHDGGGAHTYPFASFTDNGAWENLFAHAGFNINSGAFLPNLEEN